MSKAFNQIFVSCFLEKPDISTSLKLSNIFAYVLFSEFLQQYDLLLFIVLCSNHALPARIVFGSVVNDKHIVIWRPIMYCWIKIAGNGADDISYLICNYAVSIPNLAVRFPWTMLVTSLSLPPLLLRKLECF